MSNKTQEANHWTHDMIITIGSALYKLNQTWFLKIFLRALQTCSTVSKWIRAVAGEGHYKKYYHHLQQIGMMKEVHPKLKALNKTILLLFDRGYVSEEVFKRWHGTIDTHMNAQVPDQCEQYASFAQSKVKRKFGQVIKDQFFSNRAGFRLLYQTAGDWRKVSFR